MNILIVDDTELNLARAKDVIEDSNIKCDILLCNSGEQAIDIIQSKGVDIVLLDIVMPKMSGIDVLKKLKEINKLKDTIIVMFTSLTDKRYLKISLELGASDFVNKPIEPIEFISRLKSAIRLREYQKSLVESYNELKKNNTALKKVNAQLQKTQLELIHKEKLSAIGRFSAAIAHEMNTPLGYISSNFSSLKKYSQSINTMIILYKEFFKQNKKLFLYDKEAFNDVKEIEEKQEAMNIDFVIADLEDLIIETNEGITKISKIISNLISFTDVNEEYEYRYSSFQDIIKEALIVVNSELEEENIEDIVNLNLHLAEEDKIMCNGVQMQQVVINIIQNALYFIKQQGKEEKGNIEISSYWKDSYFCCDICDDGPGIEKEIIDKVFEPFFTTKEIGEGIGLGLSICYDVIVHKHKGSISVKSESGKGAKFSIQMSALETYK